MKKFIYSIIMMLFFISCDIQTAKNQFDKGDYRGSVKTTVKYISNGKYAKLKPDQKEELLSRVRIIDNYYKNTISNSNDIINIQHIYDGFAINYMLNSVPELGNELIYLNNNNADNLMYELNKKIESVLKENISLDNVERIKNIFYDMKSLNILNSKYLNVYKNISKNLADTYYMLYQNEINKEIKLKYITFVSNIYADFDNNYKNSRIISNALEKEINIEKGKKSFELGKNFYFYGKYKEAIEEFKKAVFYLQNYSEYYNMVNDAKVYLENATSKLNEIYAEKYYTLANESVAKGDYEVAEYYYAEANKYIPNYKGSYNLSKQYENKQLNKIRYSLYANNETRFNFIKQTLDKNNFEYNPYNANIYIEYYEDISYTTQQISSGVVKEVLTVRPVLSYGGYKYRGKDLVYVNEYNLFLANDLGKEKMLKLNERNINRSIENIIYDFIYNIFEN